MTKQYLPCNPQSKGESTLRETQKFGDRPSFYKRFGLKGHEGNDFNPVPGKPTPVYAVFDGNTYIKKGGAYGTRINLYDDIGLLACYCHLSRVIVSPGQRVKAGDLIGYSGNTSNYKMPIHLHFMIKECNPVTGVVKNKSNGYLGSIPVVYDKQANRLYFNSSKQYFTVKEKKEELSDVSKFLKRGYLDKDVSLSDDRKWVITLLEGVLIKNNLK